MSVWPWTLKHRQVEAVWKTKFDVLRKANTDAYGQFMSKIYKWLTWADLGACVWIRGQQGNFACMCPVVLLQHCINHACKSVCIEGFFYVNTQGLVSALCIALDAASHGDTRWLACCLQFIIHIQPLQRRSQCSKDPILIFFFYTAWTVRILQRAATRHFPITSDCRIKGLIQII